MTIRDFSFALLLAQSGGFIVLTLAMYLFFLFGDFVFRRMVETGQVVIEWHEPGREREASATRERKNSMLKVIVFSSLV